VLPCRDRRGCRRFGEVDVGHAPKLFARCGHAVHER
jgi:hypothetical protein